MKMKQFMLMLLAVLLVATIVPAAAFAADSTSGAVEIRLKTNSSTVKINGKPSTVQAPFEKSGTTMVPLSVITKAFGAKLKLQDNKIITLTYNDKTVVVTIGSKTVKVNGKAQTVAVAPVVVKGTTMVPVRVIVETFGAKIGKDKKTNEIVITGTLAQSGSSNSGGGSNGLDPDYGKTKFGDSYLGWTMNYPPGLALVAQSDDGTYAEWGSTTSKSSVIVSTEHVSDVLTSNEIRDKISVDWILSDEVVVDKRAITVNGQSFEKMVTRSTKQGLLFEYRATQQGETFYLVMVGVVGTEKSALDPYQSLLDSFVTSFNKADNTIKDITKVKDGLMSINNKEFGLSLKLPAGWYGVKDSTTPLYVSEDGIFSFTISSLQSGDTVDQWLTRMQQQLHDDFLPNYIKNEKVSSIALKDGNAQVLTYDYSYDMKNWVTVNEVYLVVGNYRYSIHFTYDTSLGAKGDALFKSTMGTVDIDTAYIEKNYGQIEDQYDNIDRTQVKTKTSSKYGYSVDLPSHWLGVDTDFNQEQVTYVGDYGSLIIQAYEDVDAATANRAVQQGLQKEGITVSDTSSITVGNSTVGKITIHDVADSGVPITQVLYFVQSKGNTLLFVFTINDSNATTSALNGFDKIVQSIKIQ
ncbi:copper amine oxidase N-terminal domain-containing protein [Paenibacillus glycanilyticus]|uniref:copper amine oxidase N-terminal domain-containing protein n=1 Tax=Paenibacillus glycanilyticus TaxID=126569 RepID=UPI00203F27BE|nr:copper amine oxidase N-terminal domain-containing protein [Paenibacillus glycanilyticus]MCM3628141.1 copper amine oxidase N-terminal domain-containing protein [Paenibacillus glycanilyticus]